MSKVCTSPVKRFAGTVVISDPLSYPQLLRFREALDATTLVKEKADGDPDWVSVNHAALPGVMACVEEYHLQGFPEHPTLETGPDAFPSTPPQSASRLLAWLVNEINALMAEAEPDPNE